MSKINLTNELLTESRRKAAVEALTPNMRKSLDVVVKDGEVKRKDEMPRFSITVPFVWR